MVCPSPGRFAKICDKFAGGSWMSSRRQAVACYRRHLLTALYLVRGRLHSRLLGRSAPCSVAILSAIQAQSCRAGHQAVGVTPTSSGKGPLVAACIRSWRLVHAKSSRHAQGHHLLTQALPPDLHALCPACRTSSSASPAPTAWPARRASCSTCSSTSRGTPAARLWPPRGQTWGSWGLGGCPVCSRWSS